MSIERKINKIMMLLVITSVLITTIIPVLGYDANNPASYTVQYIVPSDTSFAVSLCGAETLMKFNPANKNSKLVEVDCQNKASNQPWANITNSGNQNLNFSTNLTQSNPAWVELYIGSSPSMADQIIVTNSELSPGGWNNVAPDNVVQLFAEANFTDAPGGTTPGTIRINSEGS
jgi:hypothetical protein